jgi:hypothetical protein
VTEAVNEFAVEGGGSMPHSNLAALVAAAGQLLRCKELPGPTAAAIATVLLLDGSRLNNT